MRPRLEDPGLVVHVETGVQEDDGVRGDFPVFCCRKESDIRPLKSTIHRVMQATLLETKNPLCDFVVGLISIKTGLVLAIIFVIERC